MTQLLRWLNKTGHYFQGLDGGIGQIAIGTIDAREIVPESHFWLNDFIEGRLSARDIHKALKDEVTPDEIVARKKPKRMRKKPAAPTPPTG